MVNKKRLYQTAAPYPTSIAALAFSPDGQMLAVAASYTFEKVMPILSLGYQLSYAFSDRLTRPEMNCRLGWHQAVSQYQQNILPGAVSADIGPDGICCFQKPQSAHPAVQGDQPHPADAVYIRRMADAEVTPKQRR